MCANLRRLLIRSVSALTRLVRTETDQVAEDMPDPPMEWILSDQFKPQRGKTVHEIYQEFLREQGVNDD